MKCETEGPGKLRPSRVSRGPFGPGKNCDPYTYPHDAYPSGPEKKRHVIIEQIPSNGCSSFVPTNKEMFWGRAVNGGGFSRGYFKRGGGGGGWKKQ